MATLLQILTWCLYALSHTPGGKPPGHHIFFVGRAGIEKSALIAKEFNLTDTLISHVGIGIIDSGRFQIYHVEDKAGNALSISSLHEFAEQGAFYYCVYALPLPKEQFLRARALLKDHRPVKFDKQLLLKNDQLYCSEFCYEILTAVSPEKFSQDPSSKRLTSPFARSYLNRESISYIPVDFFLRYRGVFKVESAFLGRCSSFGKPLQD